MQNFIDKRKLQAPQANSVVPQGFGIKQFEESKNDDAKKKFVLTEKQIFGFIWKIPVERTESDDQVISRQLTNFIRNIECQDVHTYEDGSI